MDIVAALVIARYAYVMVPDWLQLGLLLSILFVLGAARLPGVPVIAGRTTAILRGVLGMWIARVILTGSFGITPLAELDLPADIKLFGAAAALLGGTLLPFAHSIAAQRRQEAGSILIGIVLGLLTLFEGPDSLVISAALLTSVLLLSAPKKNAAILLPLLTGVSVLVYSADNRPLALALAVGLMVATIVFEVARLLWPAWNRHFLTRMRWLLVIPRTAPSDDPHGVSLTRPLAFSNAAVGVALLIAVLDAHAALVAVTIGLFIPSLRVLLTRELRETPGAPRAYTYTAANVLAILLLLSLLLPGLPGERVNIAVAIVFAALLSSARIPMDPYTLALIAAAGTFVIL